VSFTQSFGEDRIVDYVKRRYPFNTRSFFTDKEVLPIGGGIVRASHPLWTPRSNTIVTGTMARVLSVGPPGSSIDAH
jgi:hypothetical protein